VIETPKKFADLPRDNEDRNPHAAYALMVAATIMCGLTLLALVVAVVVWLK
jgi:hypothetical protein